MPFTPRNWTDGSAPALSAANIEDLETRTTDYANLRGSAMMFDVKNDFGAVGNGVADDTAAIQDAIDAANVNIGGVVFFPPGDYNHTGISLNSMSGVRLVGVNGQTWSYSGVASRLIYTAAGTIAYDLRSAEGCNFEHLGISWSSASFTGNLISFRHGNAATDAARCWIDNCVIMPSNGIGNSPSQSVRSLVDLDSAICITVQNSTLVGGQYAIHGSSMTPGGYQYSNAMRIYNNTFSDCNPAFLCNPGENWVVRDNTFECQSWNGAGPQAVYKTHYEGGNTGQINGAMLFEGNWVGDVSGDFRRDFDCLGGANGDSTDWVIRNNQLSGVAGTAGLNFPLGNIHFEGNSINGQGKILNLGTNTGSPDHGIVRIVGNVFSQSGTAMGDVINEGGYANCRLMEMHSNHTNSWKMTDQIIFGGHVNFGRRWGETGQPTWTAGAALGTGGTVTGYGNDTTGIVTVTTGTAATSGHVATMTYLRNYDVNSAIGLDNYNRIPKVFLQKCYSTNASSKPDLYHDVDGGGNTPLTEMRLSTSTDMQDQTSYRYWYWIVV